MPFADPETKEWLKNIELGTDSVRGGPIQVMESGQSEGKEDRMAETIEKAQTFAKQKNLVEAVTLIQKALQNCSSYKQVFLWRLVLCQILMGSKNKDMSLPHLEQILQDIEKYRLETWDPKLALKGLKVAWTGFSSFSDQAFKHNAVQTLSRIAKLDPADALRLSK
jgi:type VI secretion system protein VasJ